MYALHEYIRIFNCNSKYTQYAPKCLELIDSIANELNCKAIGISIAIMEPNTWIKFHEGFVGYGEYITRGIIGIDCPDNLCALHISNGNIIAQTRRLDQSFNALCLILKSGFGKVPYKRLFLF